MRVLREKISDRNSTRVTFIQSLIVKNVSLSSTVVVVVQLMHTTSQVISTAIMKSAVNYREKELSVQL